MPNLAIIIPAVGGIEALESTLVSVLENRPRNCEVIVVLNRLYADPYDLKDEVRFVQARTGAGPTACANLGIAQTTAPNVHVLVAGCTVSEGWTEQALEHFRDAQVAAVAPLVLDRLDESRVVAAGLDYRAGGARRVRCRARLASQGAQRVFGACVLAGFYRKSALDLAWGGFCPQMGDVHADADLACTLREAGFSTMFEPAARVFADDSVQPREGAFRSGLYAQRLFWRSAPAVGWLSALACHPVSLMLHCMTRLLKPALAVELAGRVLACCQFGHYRRHYERLTQLRGLAAHLPAAEAPNEILRLDRAHSRSHAVERYDGHAKTA